MISREMDVALFLYRNICTGGAFVSQRDQNFFGSSRLMLFSVVTGVDKGE